MEVAIDFQFLFAVLLAKLKLIKNTCTVTDFIQTPRAERIVKVKREGNSSHCGNQKTWDSRPQIGCADSRKDIWVLRRKVQY